MVEGVLAAWVEIRMGEGCGIAYKEGEEGLESGGGEAGMGRLGSKV